MDTSIRLQILNSASYILHGASIIGKRINPIMFPPAMDK